MELTFCQWKKCLVLTTVRTANRAVRFAHKPNRAQPPQFGSRHEPHRDATVWFVGGANRHGSPWFATVCQTAAVHRGFSAFAIFFHALLTLSHSKSVFHLALNTRKLFSLTVLLRPLSISPSFHEHAVCKKIAFSHPLCIHPHTLTLPPILMFDHIFPVFAYSQYSTVAFLQLSLTLSIRRSRFGNFCSIAAFDSRILTTFLSSHAAPAPPSRVRSHFCCFRSLSAFDGRILATFAQLQHSTIAF